MKQWWIVKVYDKESNSTTTISHYGESIDEIKEELKLDGAWIFVSAHPESDEDKSL